MAGRQLAGNGDARKGKAQAVAEDLQELAEFLASKAGLVEDVVQRSPRNLPMHRDNRSPMASDIRFLQ